MRAIRFDSSCSLHAEIVIAVYFGVTTVHIFISCTRYVGSQGITRQQARLPPNLLGIATWMASKPHWYRVHGGYFQQGVT